MPVMGNAGKVMAEDVPLQKGKHLQGKEANQEAPKRLTRKKIMQVVKKSRNNLRVSFFLSTFADEKSTIVSFFIETIPQNCIFT